MYGGGGEGLTGGPAGPGGPLLSWVQVQALGMAGQSASFLWMIAARCMKDKIKQNGKQD